MFTATVLSWQVVGIIKERLEHVAVVALSSDSWSSKYGHRAYLGLVVHYHHKGKMIRRRIAVVEMKGEMYRHC